VLQPRLPRINRIPARQGQPDKHKITRNDARSPKISPDVFGVCFVYVLSSPDIQIECVEGLQTSVAFGFFCFFLVLETHGPFQNQKKPNENVPEPKKNKKNQKKPKMTARRPSRTKKNQKKPKITKNHQTTPNTDISSWNTRWGAHPDPHAHPYPHSDPCPFTHPHRFPHPYAVSPACI